MKNKTINEKMKNGKILKNPVVVTFLSFSALVCSFCPLAPTNASKKIHLGFVLFFCGKSTHRDNLADGIRVADQHQGCQQHPPGHATIAFLLLDN